MDKDEAKYLSAARCPYSGLPLHHRGNAAVVSDLSCDMCDCFGFAKSEVPKARAFLRRMSERRRVFWEAVRAGLSIGPRRDMTADVRLERALAAVLEDHRDPFYGQYQCRTCHAHWDKHDRDELSCPAYTAGDGSVVFSPMHHYSGPEPRLT
jgi:hypothetical protein